MYGIKSANKCYLQIDRVKRTCGFFFCIFICTIVGGGNDLHHTYMVLYAVQATEMHSYLNLHIKKVA